MYKRLTYSPSQDILWVDLADLTLTQTVIDEIVNTLIAQSATLPHKVYALICWKHTLVPMELAYYYGKQMAKAARYYLGFLRYYATTNSTYANMLLMSTPQTQVADLNYSAGTTTNIYPSKEAALEVVRKLRTQLVAAQSQPTTRVIPTETLLINSSSSSSNISDSSRHGDNHSRSSNNTHFAVSIASGGNSRNWKTPLPPQEAKVGVTTRETTRAVSAHQKREQIFYDDAFITVSWETSLKYTMAKWKKYAEGEEYQAGLNKVVELLRLKAGSLLLLDARQQGVISAADQTWTIAEWNIKVRAAGLRKTAIVLPEKVIAQMSLNKILKGCAALADNSRNTSSGSGVGILSQTECFINITQAKAWLLHQTAKVS
jgi:hypothetical protein